MERTKTNKYNKCHIISNINKPQVVITGCFWFKFNLGIGCIAVMIKGGVSYCMSLL